MSFEHRHGNKSCSACPKDQHKHLTYHMWNVICDMWQHDKHMSHSDIRIRVHRSSWWSNRSDHRSSMMIMIDHRFDHRSFLILNDDNDHKWLPLSTPSITKCVPCVLVSCVSPASCSINSFVLNNYRDRDGSVTIDSWQLIGHRQQTYGKFTNLPSYDDRLMIDDHS